MTAPGGGSGQTPVGPADEAAALMSWSALAEPRDALAYAFVDAFGAARALAWVRRAASEGESAEPLEVSAGQRRALSAAVGRWAARLPDAVPEALLERAARIGSRAVTRGAPGWPPALDACGPSAPFVLWTRGGLDPDGAWGRSVAVVGARAATAYGEHVAATIAAEAASRGITVISGGAYGIDAAAHRGALAAGGRSVAVLAGGVDRLYPSGNALLLERLLDAGAVVSEQPPGFSPHRHRFLSRNRLIAAASATVVVEAAARSGALSTARHASALARPLGAVPGPVTSAASAGCHALVRSGEAVLVSTADEALELVATLEESVARVLPEGAEDGRPDFADGDERAAHSAIGSRGSTTDAVAREAGLAPGRAQAALGTLELRGLVERRGALWWRRNA